MKKRQLNKLKKKAVAHLSKFKREIALVLITTVNRLYGTTNFPLQQAIISSRVK